MIPDDWTPREALAVYEFIDEIRDAIWDRYELELIEIMQAELSTNPADWGEESSEDPDDEISF
jgi:hypothetical protein